MPIVQDSPTTLWLLRKGMSTRECRAAFVDARVQGQLLVNGRVIHAWTSTEGASVLRLAQEWRREYLEEGWVEEHWQTRPGELR